MVAGEKPAARRGCIYILNGPNLNLLGQREPAVYGSTTLAQIRERCEAKAKSLGFTVDFRQTNFEGELVESVQQARQEACGIIINPAGYSFTSVALLDALKMFERPKIELHISNVHAREPWRKHSYVSLVATAMIAGFGSLGYELAVDAVLQMTRRAD